jgi:hypothetical protein
MPLKHPHALIRWSLLHSIPRQPVEPKKRMAAVKRKRELNEKPTLLEALFIGHKLTEFERLYYSAIPKTD